MDTILPQEEKEYIFKKVFEITEYTALDKEDQLRYEEDLKIFRDYLNTLDTAVAKGRKEGKEEGLKEGKEEGLKEGVKKKALETVQKALKLGLPVEQISLLTGLTIEEIEKVKREL
ncbi:Rpn family recombination-promoting nuclease/putative transposase [Flammeovirga yaeyamensis]|uniref:Rpn family recombination-promoting nuclease/putative transposase n=1 Tax=Flammeovirga yaeyamensis TaxID=367791 RepID=A0AAX1N9G7_9BACT|nr:hypothetical protein [Flammeovirga yaeyamensis]MBB3699416.1 putative transposase/invertase (TIGR01784 family) [Flammeovirga yaeyamensis]NMF35325.1 hypothetical protein [Flammeovirga yaeyamensis]QWG04185.1 Rpn family recombination-promoting nuclease/putative transposase [Flammeovirga yaeyamensis]